MKAVEWIDRVKAERGWDSDYRVAKELSVTRGAISGYRTGARPTLDEDVSIKVAEALGLKPAVVMFDQMKERSKSPKVQAVLDDAIRQIGGTAAGILLCVAIAVLTLASPANAYAGATNSIAEGLQIKDRLY